MQFFNFALVAAMPCLALAQVHVDNGADHGLTKTLNKRAFGNVEAPIQARQESIPTASSPVTTAVSVVVVDVYPTISTSTILSTSTVTVHQCPATVLDCPARSRSIAFVTSVVPVSISLCPTTYVSYSFSAMPTTYASGSGPSSSTNGTYGISTTVITHTPGPTISYSPPSVRTQSMTQPDYVPTASVYASPSPQESYGGNSSTSAMTTATASYTMNPLTTASSLRTILPFSIATPYIYNASQPASALYSTTQSNPTQMYTLPSSNLSITVPSPTYPSSLLPPPYGVTPTSVYTTIISTSGRAAYTSVYTTAGLPSVYSSAIPSASSIAGYTVIISGPSSSLLTTVVPYGSSSVSVLPLVTPSSAPASEVGYTVVVAGPEPSTYLTTVIPYGPAPTSVSSAASYTIIVGGPSSTLTTEVPAYSMSASSMMTYPASGYTTIVYPGYESSGLITTVIPVTGYTTGPATSAAPPTYTLPNGISSPAPGYSASVIIPGSTTIVIPPQMSATATKTSVTLGSSSQYGNGSVAQTAAPTSYTGGANKHVIACLGVMSSLAFAVLAA